MDALPRVLGARAGRADAGSGDRHEGPWCTFGGGLATFLGWNGSRTRDKRRARSLLYRLSYPLVVIQESNPAPCGATVDDRLSAVFSDAACATPTDGSGCRTPAGRARARTPTCERSPLSADPLATERRSAQARSLRQARGQPLVHVRADVPAFTAFKQEVPRSGSVRTAGKRAACPLPPARGRPQATRARRGRRTRSGRSPPPPDAAAARVRRQAAVPSVELPPQWIPSGHGFRRRPIIAADFRPRSVSSTRASCSGFACRAGFEPAFPD
jgi:hypothetical protein